MRKFFKLLPWVITAGVTWCAGFSFNAYFGGSMSWLRATYENKMAIAAQIQAPQRLLLVGGSGVHHTVNSLLMEQELGFPVLNLGLNGNLGFDVIFPLILEQVHPGDIVLVMPEYLLLLNEKGYGERSTQFGIAIGRPGLGGIPIKQFAQESFQFGIPTLRGLTKASTDLITKGYIDDYYSDPITARGDATKTWTRESDWWQMAVEQPVSNYSLEAIADFQEAVEAKGATLVLSLPIIYGRTDEETIHNVSETAEKLSEIAPTLYNPKNLNIWTDSTLFADTHYHLQPEARIQRSHDLVHELREALRDQLSPSNAPADSP